MVRDVGLAEELAQESLVAALWRWPETGVPEHPGAWLMATAKHRGVDLFPKEAYWGTAGDDWMRPALCEDALRLGRILAELVPLEAEVHGLVALMEIQASRSGARLGPAGEPILLLDQNRARWDQVLIRRGLAALERAGALGGARGPYSFQAAHAARPAPGR